MIPFEFHSTRKFASTSFGRIAYVGRGVGPTALFVHGLPLCGYQWRDVIEDLAPGRHCIALDTLGLGYTEVADDQDLSFVAQAQAITAFLDALEIDVVDLVGNDTGAGICQLFAANHPDRVRSLTLTNCEVHDRWPNELLTGFYAGMQAGAIAQGMQQMLGDLVLAHQQLGSLVYENPATFTADSVQVCLAPIVSSQRRIGQFRQLGDWATNRSQLMDAANRLRSSTIPAQVIWGDADVVFDTGPSLDWLREHLGGLQKVTVVPCAKLFWPEEHPRLLSTMLRGFWNEEDTASVMRRYLAAFSDHQPGMLHDLVAEDCVIENTGPAPDGSRHVGREACLEVWQGIAGTPDIRFDFEHLDIHDDHATIRWRLWRNTDDRIGLRGVNLMRVRDGRIVEGRGYVKA